MGLGTWNQRKEGYPNFNLIEAGLTYLMIITFFFYQTSTPVGAKF